jgi:2,3-bisphosphoglycerate-independent phosphoglycerate mutase
MATNKAVLIVIDGWGVPGPHTRPDGDAIAAAKTPVMDSFRDGKTSSGYTEIEASSNAVGLPEGLMGNSEVGHLNIGAGRVVWQDVVRIDKAIKEGTFAKTENIVRSFTRAKKGNGRLHLLGLVSDGGVHSHIEHLVALIKVAKDMQVPKVFVHFFGDGRDTDPKSGAGYMKDLLGRMKEIGCGEIATVVGRYYIMDRDKRWERVEVGLKAIVTGEGEESFDPVKMIEERYAKNETDEFLKPIIVGGKDRRVQGEWYEENRETNGLTECVDGDTLFFFNYRSDRVREATQLLGDFDRSPLPNFPYPKDIDITTMTRYNTKYSLPVAFPPQIMDDVLAEWLGKQGIKQCHVAETEKYAHVTFFFNGGVEKQFPNEERELIPSPKVATYDLQPEMSAMGVADKLCERIKDGKFEFLMNNFAPPDMVGHTGVYEAAIKACEETDIGIGKIFDTCKECGYILFVTADHG